MILASKEIIWLFRALQKSGFQVNKKLPLRSDNQASITTANKHRCPSGRAKHIDVHVHYIREHFNSSQISVSYVAPEDADILTKPFGPIFLMEILKDLA